MDMAGNTFTQNSSCRPHHVAKPHDIVHHSEVRVLEGNSATVLECAYLSGWSVALFVFCSFCYISLAVWHMECVFILSSFRSRVTHGMCVQPVQFPWPCDTWDVFILSSFRGRVTHGMCVHPVQFPRSCDTWNVCSSCPVSVWHMECVFVCRLRVS
jgi:hypothetical protein